MLTEELLHGARYATILHIERITVASKIQLRVIYRLVNDHTAPAKETLVRPEQAPQSLRVGSLVRIHFCLSRVLRIERVG